jgi:hypothetical protein
MLFSESYQIPTSSKILSYAGKLRGAGAFPGYMPNPFENLGCIFVRIHISAFGSFKANKGHRQPMLHFLLQHGLDLYVPKTTLQFKANRIGSLGLLWHSDTGYS